VQLYLINIKRLGFRIKSISLRNGKTERHYHSSSTTEAIQDLEYTEFNPDKCFHIV
jgi:hypothetical protein